MVYKNLNRRSKTINKNRNINSKNSKNHNIKTLKKGRKQKQLIYRQRIQRHQIKQIKQIKQNGGNNYKPDLEKLIEDNKLRFTKCEIILPKPKEGGWEMNNSIVKYDNDFAFMIELLKNKLSDIIRKDNPDIDNDQDSDYKYDMINILNQYYDKIRRQYNIPSAVINPLSIKLTIPGREEPYIYSAEDICKSININTQVYCSYKQLKTEADCKIIQYLYDDNRFDKIKRLVKITSSTLRISELQKIPLYLCVVIPPTNKKDLQDLSLLVHKIITRQTVNIDYKWLISIGYTFSSLYNQIAEQSSRNILQDKLLEIRKVSTLLLDNPRYKNVNIPLFLEDLDEDKLSILEDISDRDKVLIMNNISLCIFQQFLRPYSLYGRLDDQYKQFFLKEIRKNKYIKKVLYNKEFAKLVRYNGHILNLTDLNTDNIDIKYLMSYLERVDTNPMYKLDGVMENIQRRSNYKSDINIVKLMKILYDNIVQLYKFQGEGISITENPLGNPNFIEPIDNDDEDDEDEDEDDEDDDEYEDVDD